MNCVYQPTRSRNLIMIKFIPIRFKTAFPLLGKTTYVPASFKHCDHIGLQRPDGFDYGFRKCSVYIISRNPLLFIFRNRKFNKTISEDSMDVYFFNRHFLLYKDCVFQKKNNEQAEYFEEITLLQRVVFVIKVLNIQR